jgi:hypothetical protein
MGILNCQQSTFLIQKHILRAPNAPINFFSQTALWRQRVQPVVQTLPNSGEYFFLWLGARSVCFASQLYAARERIVLRELQNDKWATHRNNWPLDPGLGALSELLQIGESCCRARRGRTKKKPMPGLLACFVCVCWAAAEWKPSVKKEETTCAGRCGRALREGHFYGTSFTKPEPFSKIQPRKSRLRRDLLQQRDTSFCFCAIEFKLVVRLKHRCRLLLHVYLV